MKTIGDYQAEIRVKRGEVEDILSFAEKEKRNLNPAEQAQVDCLVADAEILTLKKDLLIHQQRNQKAPEGETWSEKFVRQYAHI